jgi:thioredoxin-like negative regulator of GroEL
MEPSQAAAELESYISFLEGSKNGERVVPFIEELLEERPEDLTLIRALAQAFHKAGRVKDAVAKLDTVAESLLEDGKKEEALVVINQILLMNPPNADQYRQLLMQLQEG